ncbi:MAG: peroxidase [Gemmatimonadetes bacterium]|nr:peroxidase [Gemmatimonadota bacterium]MDA1102631.1 peroxidase [Gemmatimonadota bacterium]
MFDSEARADAFVHAIARDWRSAELTEADQALCRYAEKLSHLRESMGPEDLDELRSHGFNDEAIHDATQVIGYFNYITRVAHALGVEAEDFIRPWGLDPV